jgi:hypothetical protein
VLLGSWLLLVRPRSVGPLCFARTSLTWRWVPLLARCRARSTVRSTPHFLRAVPLLHFQFIVSLFSLVCVCRMVRAHSRWAVAVTLILCFFLLPLASRCDAVQDMKLFSGNANVELAQQIAEHLGKKLGNITVSRFADGTHYVGFLWAGVDAMMCPVNSIFLFSGCVTLVGNVLCACVAA